MRVSKVSLCPPEPEAGGRGGVLVTLCVDVVRRVHHTHCHYKRVVAEALAALWAMDCHTS